MTDRPRDPAPRVRNARPKKARAATPTASAALHGRPTARPTRARTRGRDWRTAFLAALAESGVVKYAADAAGVDDRTARRHRAADDAFAAAWTDALECGADCLEAEAHRRAMGGSDALLMFLLKGARPHKYRDNWRPRRGVAERGGATCHALGPLPMPGDPAEG